MLITRKEPTAEFYSQAFARYRVVVEEGVLTDTQRQAQFSQYLALKAMGFNIPESLIIEKSNLQDKKELNEILDAQADQEAEMVQQQQAKEQELLRMQAIGVEAKAKNDQALAMMHLSEINLKNAENAERIQRAEQDRTAAELNFVKAIKELQGMDLQGITQKIEMLKQLGEIEHGQAEQKRAQEQHQLALQQQTMEMMNQPSQQQAQQGQMASQPNG